MVEMAKEANQDYSDNLDFMVNQEDNLGVFNSNSYSFIFTTIVLQHIPYPQSLNFIKEFARILKPGGLAVFQVPTKDVRQLSLLQRLKSFIRIRERLALLGIGKGFQMDMHTIPEDEIVTTVKEMAAEVAFSINTNHTAPDFNGNLQFLQNNESASGYISKLFIVKKS